ncbi:putative hydrolase [Hyaloscypha variabilis F]|uniref:Putative hydrolase n=1 Tax=Hyaloscypha variabilis (strain UAMH 11265 / GT02V1 / F) TaxID=1149755 RepID=A0A2J6RNZ7_HYAVF|nr:putative hydrolase [Hyaloscypha variabilis F]
MDKTIIKNALVFDGHILHTNLAVIIENGLISSVGSSIDTSNAKIIDGTGLTLLPGLIDCHVHLDPDVETASQLLLQLAKAGVTTALDMGHFPGSVRDGLRTRSGIADVRFAGTFATATGSIHSRFRQVTAANLIDDPESAVRFVEDRIAEGADYIKIVADVPGPSQEVVNALVVEARKRGMLTVAHAARKGALGMAQEGKVDIVTHAPLDFPIKEAEAKLMKDEGRVCVPTLIMEETMASRKVFPGLNYAAAKESVTLLHKAGVPILAGTDANQSPMAAVKHGEALHRELELLVDAGLSNEEALRAATSLGAQWFRLADRGVIAVGKRADLVLVGGNPVDNIAATKDVKRVWIAGEEIMLG